MAKDERGRNKGRIKDSVARKKAPESKWLARTESVYRWYDEWLLDEVRTIEYDREGQKIQEIENGDWSRTLRQYTWNENGQLASSVESVAYEPDFEYEPRYRLLREYDPRVPSFITLNHDQYWDEDGWNISSESYRQTVIRNDDGNVTLVERSSFIYGDYCPDYRLKIEYGADGKASRIEESHLYDSETGWEECALFEDIEWENTDGQILSMESWRDYLTGENRIRSAKITDFLDMDLNGNPAYWTVQYSGEEFLATANGYDAETGQEINGILRYNTLDAVADPDSPHYVNGWTLDISSVRRDESGDIVGGYDMRQRYMCDENDLLLLDVTEINDGGEWAEFLGCKVEGEVVYDEENGYPLSWTVSEYSDDWFDEDDEEGLTLSERYRIDYSDYYYNDVTGMTSVDSHSSAPVKYYTLQGRPVSKPSAGLFIRVSGCKAEKVVIR